MGRARDRILQPQAIPSPHTTSSPHPTPQHLGSGPPRQTAPSHSPIAPQGLGFFQEPPSYTHPMLSSKKTPQQALGDRERAQTAPRQDTASQSCPLTRGPNVSMWLIPGFHFFPPERNCVPWGTREQVAPSLQHLHPLAPQGPEHPKKEGWARPPLAPSLHS